MSGGETRAFAAKRQKTSAADIRKQAAEMADVWDAESQSASKSEKSVSLEQCLTSADSVTPVDVEEILSSRPIKRIEIKLANGRIQRVNDYNEKDLSIASVPRDLPFCSLDEKKLDASKVEPHVHDLIQIYKRDYALVERHFQQFSTADAFGKLGCRRAQLALCGEKQTFESDPEEPLTQRSVSQIEDSHDAMRSSTASGDSADATDGAKAANSSVFSDPIFVSAISHNWSALFDSDDANKELQGNGKALVSLFVDEQKIATSAFRSNVEIPPVLPPEFLSVRVRNMELEPKFEPIFASFAFYDLQAKKRVSENFHFDFNTREMLGLIRSHLGVDAHVYKIREALISLENFNPNVFLVIRLEKVLQASDISEAVEPYVSKDKPKEKLVQNAREFCDRLGAYRMAFGWTFVGLHSLIKSQMNKTADTKSEAPAPPDVNSMMSGDRMSSSTIETLQHSSESAPTLLSRSDSATDVESKADCSAEEAGNSRLFAFNQPVRFTIFSMIKSESEKLGEEDLLKALSDVQKAGGSMKGRFKTFPINLELEFTTKKAEDLDGFLSAEGLPIGEFVADAGEKAREMIEFPVAPRFVPHSVYRNLLYIYPRFVNFSGKSGVGRNIAVRLELFDGQHQPLKVFFGKSSGPKRLERVYTSVSYHSKTPSFADEIKMEIPADIDDSFYLLFTFCHVSCKKEAEVVETPIGYTWHPLYTTALQTGELNLPISLDSPPTGITFISPANNVPQVNWLSGHKELFNVHLTAVSTVHPEDAKLSEFFRLFHSLSRPQKRQPAASEQELQNAIRNLPKAEPSKLCAYLYVIFDKLIALITSPPYSEQLSVTCFDALVQLVKLGSLLLDKQADKFGRSTLLSTYIKYHSTISRDKFASLSTDGTATVLPPSGDGDSLMNLIKSYEKSTKVPLEEENTRLLHEELASLFLQTSGSIREQTAIHSSFFLELMAKAIAESLHASNRFPLPRKLRVSDRFLENVVEITEILTNEAIDRAANDITRANRINAALAFFVHDLFPLLDRTFLMNRIRRYNKLIVERICETTDPLQTTLMSLKLEFMRIVCSHEHFVVLNVPFDFQSAATSQAFGGFKPSMSLTGLSNTSSTSGSSNSAAPPSPSGSSLSSRSSFAETHLSATYRTRHFLLGIVLSDLGAALNSTNVLIHSRAIRLLSSLLMTHESDERLNDQNAALRNRVASLYLPLISILMDVRGILFDPNVRTNSSASRSKLITTKAAASSASIDRLPIEHHAIAGVGGSNPKHNGHLSKEITMELLCCFCWVLKNVDRPVLHSFLKELPLQGMQQFVDLLQLCVSVFEYKPQAPAEQPPAIRRPRLSTDQTAAVEEPKTLRTRKLSGNSANVVVQPPSSTVRWRQTSSTAALNRHSSAAFARYLNNNGVVLERQLATEVGLTVLNSMAVCVRVILLPESDHFLFILPNIIRVLMHLLSTNQSSTTLESAFVLQRALVAKFPMIFEQSELSSDLCLQLLRQSSSRMRNIRSNAAASLYLLLRYSFFVDSYNFSKVKTQITMALSTLSAGSSTGFVLHEENLRRALKTTLVYLKHDMNSSQSLRETSFGSQVQDLIFNLHMILSDTLKMRDFTDDAEMLVDLMYRIAHGYLNNSDLRLTWLINIANKHAGRRQYAEVAQCYLHAAALAAEYIEMRNNEEGIPGGASAFLHLSSNIEEESAISDDVINPNDEEGLCASSFFTINGFLYLIEKTVDFFEKAQFFELIPQLYKIVEPIVTKQRNFALLAKIHARITANLEKVEPTVEFREDIADAFLSPLRVDKRNFGTYFRVRFIGARFGDLNGEEFIYKEPSFTKLSEISQRLFEFYTAKFGKNVVEVVKDSNDLDPRQLDQSKAFLQITFVEPFFDTWEKRRRTTHLERNYGINRFVYSTPFTRDGRPHGELKDQYKRRTILTTQHFFPFVKTRLRVIDREQKVLAPIEVAIEDLQKRKNELHAALQLDPPDLKMLQMLLQGCIGTTVNQGCIAIARTFLSNMEVDERGVPVDRNKNKLKLCFKSLSKTCSDALQRNEALISVEQLDYQKELRKNYCDFTQQLAQILIGPVGMAELADKLPLNPRTDRTLPINLHTYTSHVISSVGEVGPISSV